MGGSENLFLPNVEWIGSTDVRVILALLDGIGSPKVEKRVLEVGVWKGSFCQAILVNRSSSSVLGIDPYPGSEMIRESMFENLRQLGIDNRFRLVEDWSDLERAESFDLVHIDGLHTENAVRRDLLEASRVLQENGILVVDDIRHFWFPGIASAVYTFIANSEFRILAMSATKAYLARAEVIEHYQSLLRDAIGKLGDLVVSDYFGQQGGEVPVEFAQIPEVRSVRPLLIHSIRSPRGNPVGTFIAMVIPPLFIKLFMFARKILKQLLAPG